MEELGSRQLFGDDFGGERMWGLREFSLQDTVSLFPQTAGWVLLALLLLALLVINRWRRYQYWKQQAFRRNAIRSLMQMKNDLSQIQRLPHLLRQVALKSSPREEVIALQGPAWIAWLNDKAGGPVFREADAELLHRLAYAQSKALDPETSRQLIAATLQWVSTHHV